jgi:hypothetical protein
MKTININWENTLFQLIFQWKFCFVKLTIIALLILITGILKC